MQYTPINNISMNIHIYIIPYTLRPSGIEPESNPWKGQQLVTNFFIIFDSFIP